MAMFLTLPYMEMFEKLPKTEHSLKTLPFLAFSRDIAVFGSRLYCISSEPHQKNSLSPTRRPATPLTPARVILRPQA